MLDTFVYGAHTTASDALWGGVPIVTRPGLLMQSRVAASLLTAAGLGSGADGLVVASSEEYVSAAVALANSPPRLRALKDKVLEARDSPVFDTALWVANFEAGVREAADRLASRGRRCCGDIVVSDLARVAGGET